MTTSPVLAESPPRASLLWWVIIVVAWLVGIQLWLLTDFWLVRTPTQLTVYAAALAVCFIEPFRRLLFRLGDLLNRRGRIATPAMMLSVSALTIVLLYATAVHSNRRFSPVFHDEFSYLLQASMLAQGHLSMPAHPLGDFFDTFYVITDRAYASQYFPGAALMFMPGVWLGFAGWVMPLAITGAAAGMMFLVIRELFDGLCGLAAVIILCGVVGFRFLSLSPIAQVPALLLGLVALYASLKWLSTRQLRWIVVCGIAIGWMAITRPLDAMVYAIPLATLILIAHARSKPAGKTWPRLLLAGLVPLVPFLSLQLVLNHRVTGDWLKTPFSYYASRDLPGTSYGFHTFDPTLKPASPLPQKQIFFEKRVKPTLEIHSPARAIKYWAEFRAKTTLNDLAGDMLLLIPIPAALVCLRDPRRWAVVSILLVWCVAYSLYVFAYAHYYVAILPPAMLLILAGFESIPRLLPRSADAARAMQFVVPSVVSVMVLPQFKTDVLDQFVDSAIESVVREFEQKVPEPQAILMVRYGADSVPEWEVVYNIHDAWPDDARVIRAHDLGADRNRELYRYYASRSPDRMVYLYDRGAETFTRLGRVADLAETSGRQGDSIPSSQPMEAGATTNPK